MKTKLIVLLVVATVVLGLLTLRERREIRVLRTDFSKVEQELQTEKQLRVEKETRARDLETQYANQSEELLKVSRQLGTSGTEKEVIARTKVAAIKKAAEMEEGDELGMFGGKGMMKKLGEMMKDPAMKEMMRTQQKQAMNMMYGPMFKEMNLPQEQKEKLTELLLDQQMTMLEIGQKVLNEGEPNLALGEAAQKSQAESEELIKGLLGDEKFAEFNEYKKTMGERMILEQFKQQLDGTAGALKDDQFKQLLVMMHEERSKTPAAITPEDPPDPANFERQLSPEFMEKQFLAQEEVNRRVLERAGTVLSAEQLKTYGEFQTQQINMGRMSMKMTREFFKEKKPAPPAQVPEK